MPDGYKPLSGPAWGGVFFVYFRWQAGDAENDDLYRARGRIIRENNELFSEVGSLQVMHGQGLAPRSHHPLADLVDEHEIAAHLEETESVIRKCVQVMPGNTEFIAAIKAAGKR